ncbi:hypothetical protein ACI78V_02385 [Geodermatophilus sp. SYSU D00742]
MTLLECKGNGPFEEAGYIKASAAHEGSVPVVVDAGRARLTLLRTNDGSMHTVYGYPHPVGQVSECDLMELAEVLALSPGPLRVALSPVGCGALLAQCLRHRVPVVDERIVGIADLDGDPLDAFKPKARAMVRRALRYGASARVGPVEPDFGVFYRRAMRAVRAGPLYHFGNPYFDALARSGAFQVTARDAHGVSAAAIFLARGADASYHLSASRAEPRPEAGSVNLVVLEGLRECARRGAVICVLGGGTTAAPDDTLLHFKASMATRMLRRPTFQRGTV